MMLPVNSKCSLPTGWIRRCYMHVSCWTGFFFPLLSSALTQNFSLLWIHSDTV